jgi:hypothetical protein
MRRADWTLLAVTFANGNGLTPVQLQKSLFVLGRELPKEAGPDFYEFVAYDYGPFARSIYTDAQMLADAGLIAIGADKSGLRIYTPTLRGFEVGGILRGNASTRAVEYLKSVVAWAQSLPFPELIQSIYARYPDTAVNSVFSSQQPSQSAVESAAG